MVRSLPLILRERLSRLADHPWPLRHLWSGRLLLGILVGSVSHIVWDAFTHDYTFVTVRAEWLTQLAGPMRLYRWLQYISSVLGLAAIAWFFWKLPVRPRLVKATSKIQSLFWIFNGILTGTFWAFFLLVNEKDERWLIVSVVVTGISAVSLSQVLTSLLMRRYFQPSQQARATRTLSREISHELARNASTRP